MPDEAKAVTQTLSLRQALTEATDLYRADRLAETQELCRQLLAARPNTHPALQLLGLIERRQGRNEAAAELLRQAIALKPNHAEYHCNLGVILQDLGRLDEALGHYRQALSLKPNLRTDSASWTFSRQRIVDFFAFRTDSAS
jgi:Flp pilus assembly protein TadD